MVSRTVMVRYGPELNLQHSRGGSSWHLGGTCTLSPPAGRALLSAPLLGPPGQRSWDWTPSTAHCSPPRSHQRLRHTEVIFFLVELRFELRTLCP
jgi:hypothetical protein